MDYARTIIDIMFLSPEQVLWGMTAGLFVFMFCCFFKFKKVKWMRKTCIALLFIYFGAVISLTIPIVMPWNWNYSSEAARAAVDAINWVPFRDSLSILRNSMAYDNMQIFTRLIIGNFIMLMPLGILMPIINPSIRFSKMLVIACTTAIMIEGTQFLMNMLAGSIIRAVEIDDFLLNVSGCMLAYCMFAFFLNIVSPVRRKARA